MRRRERGGWFYPHSLSWKKNAFEREEEDGKDGFIHIHPVAKKERKKGLKDKKRTERMKKWNLGNEVMDLPMGVKVFIKIGNEYSGIYTMGNEYNEINRKVNINYKNLI